MAHMNLVGRVVKGKMKKDGKIGFALSSTYRAIMGIILSLLCIFSVDHKVHE